MFFASFIAGIQCLSFLSALCNGRHFFSLLTGGWL